VLYDKINKLIFFKPWRVSGTSLQSILLKYISKNSIVSGPSRESKSQNNTFKSKKLSYNACIFNSMQTLAGKKNYLKIITSQMYYPIHYSVNDFIKKKDVKELKKNFSFSIIRNPFDFYLSVFLYNKKQNTNFENVNNMLNILEENHFRKRKKTLTKLLLQNYYRDKYKYHSIFINDFCPTLHYQKIYEDINSNKILVDKVYKMENIEELFFKLEHILNLKKETLIKDYKITNSMASNFKDLTQKEKKNYFSTKAIDKIFLLSESVIKKFDYKLPTYL
jgi:hypothetical protein